MTCKDCIHYAICDPYVAPNESFPEVEGGCTAFSDRGEFVDYRNIPYIKAEVRADTVRKMQERLIYTLCINNEENTDVFDYAYTLETIDQIAKEMIEDAE